MICFLERSVYQIEAFAKSIRVYEREACEVAGTACRTVPVRAGSIIRRPRGGVSMAVPTFEGWTCPVPLQNYPTIVMGHGAGGKMMSDLIRHLFAAEFGGPLLEQMADAASIRPARADAWRLPPIHSSSARSSFRAATSVNWRSTARSTIWP